MYMQKQLPLASLDLVNHSSEQLLSWIKWRSNEGAAPATVAQSVAYLEQVFGYTRSAWGKQINLDHLSDVKRLAYKHGVIDKSEQVDRRSEREKLDKILRFFDKERTEKWENSAPYYD